MQDVLGGRVQRPPHAQVTIEAGGCLNAPTSCHSDAERSGGGGICFLISHFTLGNSPSASSAALLCDLRG
jgi:hypothetical protein